MKKIRMRFPNEKTFREGFEEYILDCKARNLRDGTINHYQESIKQIYKRITPDTLISSMCQQTMANFYISLRDDPNLNEVSMGTGLGKDDVWDYIDNKVISKEEF